MMMQSGVCADAGSVVAMDGSVMGDAPPQRRPSGSFLTGLAGALGVSKRRPSGTLALDLDSLEGYEPPPKAIDLTQVCHGVGVWQWILGIWKHCI